jgi:hypothetical protein
MITKKNRPMRAIFFRDHEISEVRAGPDPLTAGVRAAGRRGVPSRRSAHLFAGAQTGAKEPRKPSAG